MGIGVISVFAHFLATYKGLSQDKGNIGLRCAAALS